MAGSTQLCVSYVLVFKMNFGLFSIMFCFEFQGFAYDWKMHVLWGPLRGESSFMDLDLSSLKSMLGGQNWMGKQVHAVDPSGGFLIIAGEEVQFFCTVVTLFAQSIQVKTFEAVSSEYPSPSTLQQEYTVLGRLFSPYQAQSELRAINTVYL